MKKCGSCGSDNETAAEFCLTCHQFLGWDTDDIEAVPGHTSPQTPPAVPSSTAPPAPRPVPAQTQPAPAKSGGVPAAPGDRSAVQEVLAAITTGREIASSHGRRDLDEHLGRARARLARQPISVVTVGQFKQGKTSLINALLQTDVLPVDADVVTAVPTTVVYADHPRVSTFSLNDAGDRVDEVEMPMESLPLLVTEAADPADPKRQRFVEVGLPHRMLRSGLCLIDTPGVGGLDSAHGFLTLGALRQAQAVLFVTDASQELTEPELSFLRSAVARCPLTALVVTKRDLYPRWREIEELNRGHLAAAEITIPVIALSSFLRLRAPQDRRLDQESGFTALVEFLGRDVVLHHREQAARTAAQEVEFVAGQLDQQSAAELTVIDEPQHSEEVVAELEQKQTRATRLASPTATWQQFLADEIQDLISNVEHDLQSRLRAVLHDAEEVIDQGDPQQTWDDTEVWLRRQVAMATVHNSDLLALSTQQIATSVAEQFNLQAEPGTGIRLEPLGEGLDAVQLAAADSLSMQGGRLGGMVGAARTGFYVPMVTAGLAAHLGLLIAAPIIGAAVVLGVGIGHKMIKDERKRQRTYRQQQAKAAARRYVDEVMFLMGKQTRDGLRSAQRQLRDDFQARAQLLQRSAMRALEAAQRTSTLDDESQRSRGRELAEQRAQLGEVRESVRELATVGADG